MKSIPIPEIWIEHVVDSAQKVLDISLSELNMDDRALIVYFAGQVASLKVLLKKYDSNNSRK